MLLIDELGALEEKVKVQASTKEIAFYQKLIGDPISYPNDQKLVDIEQVCLSAFCLNSPRKLDIVRSLQRRKPIKGMHYSNNLLDLIACATHDFEGEKEHIKLLCKDSSARDSFILQKLFPKTCSIHDRIDRSVDRIAVWLARSDFPADWKSVFVSALQDVDSLLDIYILREGYTYLLMTHSFAEAKRDVDYLSIQTHYLLEYVRKQKYFWFNLQLCVVITSVFTLVAYLAYSFWDTAEPITWIAEITLGCIAFLLLIYGRKIDAVQLVLRQRKKIFKNELRKAKVDLELVQAMVRKYSE